MKRHRDPLSHRFYPFRIRPCRSPNLASPSLPIPPDNPFQRFFSSCSTSPLLTRLPFKSIPQVTRCSISAPSQFPDTPYLHTQPLRNLRRNPNNPDRARAPISYLVFFCLNIRVPNPAPCFHQIAPLFTNSSAPFLFLSQLLSIRIYSAQSSAWPPSIQGPRCFLICSSLLHLLFSNYPRSP